MKPLGLDFADYCEQFDALYRCAMQAAFGGPHPNWELKGANIYYPELVAAAATAGYELEVSPGKAVGLMVVVETVGFRTKHGTVSRILRPSLREAVRDRDAMLKLLPPLAIYLQEQPLIHAFMERVTHHLRKDLARHSAVPVISGP